MATSKNNPNARNGNTLQMFCPDCGSELQLVRSTAKGQSGMYCTCKKCTFREKYVKGSQYYKKYEHKFTSRK